MTPDDAALIAELEAVVQFIRPAAARPTITAAAAALRALSAENERFWAALAEIRDAHIPDQPASSGLSDGEWIVEHVRRLRKMALEALCHD